MEPYQVLPLMARVDQGVMAMKKYSKKLQHYCNLTIRMISVIFQTLVGGRELPLCRDAVGVFYSPRRLGWN